jgi:sodium/potassium-transporting ATPase subunit beta
MENYESNEENVPVTHPSRLKRYADVCGRVCLFIVNPETREIIGRDGLSWAKVSACYFVFYTMLGTFFVALLAVFVATMSRQTPTYYSETSVMATRSELNPGLGFRPQLDPEDHLIYFGNNESTRLGEIELLTRNLNIYLDKFYDQRSDKTTNELKDCDHRDLAQLRLEFKEKHAHCAFDYRSMLDNTDCSPSENYGYAQNGPCVLIKLNRIYGWTPRSYTDLERLALNQTIGELDMSVLGENIVVMCDGEFGTDRDALAESNVTYYSVNSRLLHVNHVGLLPFYYFPYLNQPNYKSPLVFVKFSNLPPDFLINVICRAYAQNIDSDDKMNMRGMTKFQLYAGGVFNIG